MIRLETNAVGAIKDFLSEKGLDKPLRVELQSSGCCDAVLGLSVDTLSQNDRVYESDGLTFVITPELEQQVGDVTISHVADTAGTGFVITSTIPISEWAGFGVCKIRTMSTI